MTVRWAAVLALVLLFVASGVSASPLWVEPPPIPWAPVPDPPVLEAESWLLFDDGNEVVLAEHQADVRRPMASTTKLMSALLAVEMGDLSSPVRVSGEAVAVGEAGVDLVEGEVFLLRTLVRAFLVRSGNDAAYAVAEHLGGTVEDFVSLMNERAGQLGMEDTSYTNPHGLDHPDQYSTATDLLILTRQVLQHSELAEAVATPQITLRESPSGEERVFSNTNDLLFDYDGMVGVKTGFTDDAGRVLVAAAERGGRRLLSVVMKTGDHFADTRRLLDYGFDFFGAAPSLVFGDLRLSREQVLAAYAPPATTTTTTAAEAQEPEPAVEAAPVQPVAVRVGRTPQGLGDLLGWILRLFSSGQG